VAVRYGSVPAIVTTVVSDICAAYFLYPPDFSIYIADPLQMAELSFFSLLVLATSQFVGGFADDERSRKRAGGR
jgi:K+-sensing histidine kinase KdpD